jgi:thiol:disulfide interchange protein DsbD
MKKLILSFLLFSVFMLQAQQNPVSWFATYKKISASEGEITITAAIEKGWHTYSQRPTDAGPIPTSFKYNDLKQFTLIGKTEESDAHEEFVKAFDAKIFVFNGKATFTQKVKMLAKNPIIKINVEYMCCNDNMCLPPKTVELNVKTE